MKKVLAIACLVAVLVIALAAMASAAETSWRFNIKADDPTGMNAQTEVLGVYSTSKDPLPSDVVPLSDGQDVRWTALSGTLMAIGGVFPIDTAGTPAMWGRDIKGPLKPWNEAYPGHKKVWSIRVAGAGSATNATIRLQFTTVGSTVLPPATLTHPTLGAVPVQYYLKMVNNRAKIGAPGNGMVWLIPIPTVHSGTPYFTLTLPAFNISVAQSEAKMIDEGYVMEFYQTPEPSSLLALGAGLMGLAGFASRRRRG